MICKVVDTEEAIPFGELVSIDLDTLTQEDNFWVDVEWQGSVYTVFRSAMVAKEVETVEESLWVYEAYKKLLSREKITILNIDPSACGIDVNEEDDYYYGGYLTKGESFNGTEQADDQRALFYRLFLQMLEEDEETFVEIRVEVLENCVVYRSYFHENGLARPACRISNSENVEEVTRFFDQYLK